MAEITKNSVRKILLSYLTMCAWIAIFPYLMIFLISWILAFAFMLTILS